MKSRICWIVFAVVAIVPSVRSQVTAFPPNEEVAREREAEMKRYLQSAPNSPASPDTCDRKFPFIASRHIVLESDATRLRRKIDRERVKIGPTDDALPIFLQCFESLNETLRRDSTEDEFIRFRQHFDEVNTLFVGWMKRNKADSLTPNQSAMLDQLYKEWNCWTIIDFILTPHPNASDQNPDTLAKATALLRSIDENGTMQVNPPAGETVQQLFKRSAQSIYEYKKTAHDAALRCYATLVAGATAK